MKNLILFSYLLGIICLVLFFAGIIGKAILFISLFLSWAVHVIEYNIRNIKKR